MHKPMRTMNLTLLVLLVIALISSALSTDAALTGTTFLGFAIWLVTLGSAHQAAAVNATEISRNVAWWSNIALVTMMIFSAMAMTFVVGVSSGIFLCIMGVPMAFNVYWLHKMRRAAAKSPLLTRPAGS